MLHSLESPLLSYMIKFTSLRSHSMSSQRLSACVRSSVALLFTVGILGIVMLLALPQSVAAQGLELMRMNVDSLKLLEKKASPDVGHVNILLALSAKYITVSADTAVLYANQALDLAKQIKAERETAVGKYRLGNGYFMIGKNKESVLLMQEALDYFENAKDTTQIIPNIKASLAEIYVRESNYALALQYRMKALDGYQQLKTPDMLKVASILSDIGVLHRYMENDSLALSYYRQALTLYNEKLEGTIKEDLAIKVGILLNFGDVYMNTKKFAEAQRYFEDALNLSEKLGDVGIRAFALENLGLVYVEIGRNTQALPKLQEALKLFQSLGSQEDIGLIYSSLSRAYLNLGSTDLALYNAQQAIQMGKAIQSKGILREGYEQASQAYERLGDNTNAFKYYRLATVYKDSIFKDDASKAMSRMNALYQVDKSEKEKQLLQADKEKQDATIKQQRAISIAIGVGLFMVVVLAVILFRANAEKKRTNDLLSQQNEIIAEERQKSERLLLNILPPPIAERMKRGETSIAEYFPNVTCIFSDIVGFTKLSQRVSPEELVSMLDEIFSRMDQLADFHGVEKIKTIGDAYMVVSGLPVHRDDHAAAAARMAISMQEMFEDISSLVGMHVEIRIGMHIGDAVAGIIGKRKFAYDLWGDTVNTAARMESHGEPGRVHCSQVVYEALKDEFDFEDRGTMEVKGKGQMHTYFLLGPKQKA